MKKIVLAFLLAQLSLSTFAQFVARAEIKEDVQGICDKKNVYALLEMMKGQKEAVCTVKEPEIEKALNDSVQFVKTNPEYKDKGMVSIIINCKGEVVQCKMDNKTKDTVLD